MKSALIAILLLSFLPAHATAQPFPEEVIEAAGGIDPAEIEAHVRFLADDLLEGRDTGSRGYEIAARYVATRFLAAGLAPGGDEGTWFQYVPMRSATLVSSTMSYRQADGSWSDLEPRREFVAVADPEHTSSTVESEAVFAGYGVTAPELRWDDYEGIDVEGKIVVTLRNAPAKFPSSQRAHFASTSEKRRNAAAHGAIALVELATPDEEKRVPWNVLAGYSDHPTMRWTRADGSIHEGLFGLRAHARISRQGAHRIFEGSPVALATILAAADSGEDLRSHTLPHRVRITTRSTHETISSPNVVGILPGNDPDLKDEFVVLVAHLDHVGIGTPHDGDALYNGAHDNASGVATMLAVVRALGHLEKSPARSIAFVAVTAEEKGLLGADYFAEIPPEPVGEIVAAFSLDMFLMLFPLHDIVAYGAEHSSLGKDVEKAAAAMGLTLTPDPTPEEALFVRTDHYAFVQRGVPALYLGRGHDAGDESIDGAATVRHWMRTVYHRPSDDMSQFFDWQAGADFASLNLLLTWEVANDPGKPEWHAGDFFERRFGRR